MTTLFSPAQITRDTPTAIIEQSITAWNEIGKGAAETIWEILKFSGKPAAVPAWQRKDILIFEHGNIAIIGSERQGLYRPEFLDYQIERNFSVFVRDPKKKEKAAFRIDEIILNSNCVMSWGWILFYGANSAEHDKTERSEKNFCINGAWVSSILVCIEDAYAEKEKEDFENIANARNELLNNVLAGSVI